MSLSSPDISSIISPESIITVLFPVLSAEFMLWVIIIVVILFLLTILFVISITFSAVAGSSAAVCSSSKRSFGVTSVHIRSVTTCLCPPESSPTFVFILSSSPISNSARAFWKNSRSLFLTAIPRGPLRLLEYAKARFSSIVMLGAVPFIGS